MTRAVVIYCAITCAAAHILQVGVFVNNGPYGRKVFADPSTISWRNFTQICAARHGMTLPMHAKFRDKQGAEIRGLDELDTEQELVLAVNGPQKAPKGAAWLPKLAVVGQGVSAHAGLKAWDPWVVSIPGRGWRLYYLTAWWPSDTSTPFWFNSDIATTVSADMQSWEAPEQVQFSNWRYGATGVRLLAGDAIHHAGFVWLLFSTGNTKDREESDIALCKSTDGIVFEVVSHSAVARPGTWQSNAWRDPFLFSHKGRVGVMVSGRGPNREDATPFELCDSTDCMITQYRAAVGLAWVEGDTELKFEAVKSSSVTDTIQLNHHVHNSEQLKQIDGRMRRVVRRFMVKGPQEGFWEIERQQVLERAGRFHMFFNCWRRFVNQEWLAKHLGAGAGISESTLYHLEASSIDGPYTTSERTPIVPGSGSTGLYGLRFIDDGDSNSRLIWGWYVGEFSLHLKHTWRLGWDQNQQPFIFHVGK